MQAVSATKLTDILSPAEDTGTLRWRVTVPMGTNPFILLELAQFALAGAAVVLVTLCIGVWFTEGSLAVRDIFDSLGVALMVFIATVTGFLVLVFVFFSNRYFTTYHLDSSGIYHEGSRGDDERKEFFSLHAKPYPVVGTMTASRTRSRHLIWEKVDRFQNIPGMRVILLRRGMWHMARLYTPDAETHGKVVQYLRERRLKEV